MHTTLIDQTTVIFRDCTGNDNTVAFAREACFSHLTDDSFRVEENVDGVIIGRVGMCLYDHDITRSYEVASREYSHGIARPAYILLTF